MQYLKLLRSVLVVILSIMVLPLTTFAQDPLDETYTSEDDTFTFRYPSDWILQDEQALITLADSRATIESFDNGEFLPDHVIVFIYKPVWVENFLQGSSTHTSHSGQEYAEAFMDAINEPHSQPTAQDLGNRSVIQSRIENGSYDGLFIAFNIAEDSFVGFLAATAKDEFETFEPTVMAIAESLDYLAAETADTNSTASAATFVSPDGLLTFDYPSDWIADQSEENDALIGTSENALSGDVLPAGEGRIIVLTPASTEYLVTQIDPSIEFASADLYSIMEPMMLVYYTGGSFLSEPEETTIGGKPAVSFSTVGQNDQEISIMVLDSGENNILTAILMTAPGKSDQYQPAFLQVAESLSYATDDTTTCAVSVGNTVNKRSGPGTDFDVAGQLTASDSYNANGQTTGADGYVWWRLTDNSWVRSDVVITTGECSSLPEISP